MKRASPSENMLDTMNFFSNHVRFLVLYRPQTQISGLEYILREEATAYHYHINSSSKMILPISLPAMMAAVNTTSSLPPNLRGSLSKDKKVASVFQPAADLDVFRNTDQARFEWVNSSEIQAGQATCGFLKSPWGWPVGSIPDFMNLEIASISPLLKFVSIVLWSHYWYLENDLFILYLHIQNTTQTYVSGLLKNSQHLGVTL